MCVVYWFVSDWRFMVKKRDRGGSVYNNECKFEVFIYKVFVKKIYAGMFEGCLRVVCMKYLSKL